MAKSENFSSLHSYARNKWISLSKAHASDTLSDLFNLPFSVEALMNCKNWRLDSLL
jgi:hypothetical protein